MDENKGLTGVYTLRYAPIEKAARLLKVHLDKGLVLMPLRDSNITHAHS
jgi:hypothetical protein